MEDNDVDSVLGVSFVSQLVLLVFAEAGDCGGVAGLKFGSKPTQQRQKTFHLQMNLHMPPPPGVHYRGPLWADQGMKFNSDTRPVV